MTVSEVDGTSSTEKFLLRALIISLLVHASAYSLWRVGQAEGWWRDMVLPHWMQVASKAMLPRVSKKPAADIISQTQLTFVEVDPALATPQPPKKPMFEGAQSTVAANREIKVISAMPNLEGQQEKFLKTTENAKPKAQPAPAIHPQAQPQPRPAPAQTAPRQSYTPGDLVMARPSDKPQPGKADADAGDEAKPQPAYQRPRTLAEAEARSGSYGAQTREAGGVRKVSYDFSLDVQGTPRGDYIARMVDAVREHWYQLLVNQSADIPGKVVLHFRLHPDGRISDMTVLQNEVSDLLQMTCERAVLDPKFPKWPREMRLELPSDFYDITFTFYYEP